MIIHFAELIWCSLMALEADDPRSSRPASVSCGARFSLCPHAGKCSRETHEISSGCHEIQFDFQCDLFWLLISHRLSHVATKVSSRLRCRSMTHFVSFYLFGLYGGVFPTCFAFLLKIIWRSVSQALRRNPKDDYTVKIWNKIRHSR